MRTVGGRDWGVRRWKGVQTGDGYAVVNAFVKTQVCLKSVYLLLCKVQSNLKSYINIH